MTPVPKKNHILSEWANILGQKFLQNAVLCDNPSICRKHFNVKWSGQRPKNLIPVAKDLNAKAEKKKEQTTKKWIAQRICAYCEKEESFRNMTMVPTVGGIFDEWVKILGHDFYVRAMMDKKLKMTSMICKTHFNAKFGHNRPSHLLPCANRTPISAEPPVKLEEPDYESLELLMKSENPSENYLHLLDKEIKPEYDDQEFENEKFVEKNLITSCNSYNSTCQHGAPEHTNVKIEIKEEEKPNYLQILNQLTFLMYRQTCIYCGDSKDIEFMTKIPRSRNCQLKWEQILGSQYAIKSQTRFQSMICLNHFENVDLRTKTKRWPYPRILPYRNKKVLDAENPGIARIAARFKPQINATCMFCKEKRLLKHMTMIPKNEVVRQAWSEILHIDLSDYENLIGLRLCISHIMKKPWPDKNSIYFDNVAPQKVGIPGSYHLLSGQRKEVVQAEGKSISNPPSRFSVFPVKIKAPPGPAHEPRVFKEAQPECSYLLEKLQNFSEIHRETQDNQRAALKPDFNGYSFHRPELSRKFHEISKTYVKNIVLPEEPRVSIGDEPGTSYDMITSKNLENRSNSLELSENFLIQHEKFRLNLCKAQSRFEKSLRNSKKLIMNPVSKVQVASSCSDSSQVSSQQVSSISDENSEGTEVSKPLIPFFSCTYCSAQTIYLNDMIEVPKDRRILDLWKEHLGEQFRQNLENVKFFPCRICKIHFKRDSKGRIEQGSLPCPYKKSKVNDPFLITYETNNIKYEVECAFCENRQSVDKMMNTPEDIKELEIWAKFLGAQFFKRCRNLNEPSYMCAEHYYLIEFDPKSIPEHENYAEEEIFECYEEEEAIKEEVPYALDESIEEKKPDGPNIIVLDVKKEDCQESIQELESEQKPPNLLDQESNTVEREYPPVLEVFDEKCVKQEDQNWNPEMEKKSVERLDGNSDELVFGDSEFMEVSEIKQEDQSEESMVSKKKYERKRTCCFCGIVQLRTRTVCVPTSEVKFQKWVSILGPVFLENCRLVGTGAICVSHFEVDDQGGRSMYPFAGVNSGMDLMTEKPRRIAKKKSEYLSRRVCVYCGVPCVKSKMTSVPYEPKIIEQWNQILGPEFVKNCRFYSLPYICLAHFKAGEKPKGWKMTTLPIANGVNKEGMEDCEKMKLEGMNARKLVQQSMKDRSVPLASCAYCGAKRFQKLMTSVPITEKGIKEWSHILGDEFEQNCRTSIHSFICLEHFEKLEPNGKRARFALPVP